MGLPARTLWDRFSLVWSSCFGAGYFPYASGTFGTLVALPAAYLLSLVPSAWVWALLVGGYTAVTVVTAQRAGKLHGVPDAKQIVADEWAGFFVAVALVPFTWQVAVAGFFLFRFFDIFKPWPASFFDRRVKNGFGVTFDDIAAGLWARFLLEVLLRLGLLGN
jgi:phosphatidylglycerophosphatase A